MSEKLLFGKHLYNEKELRGMNLRYANEVAAASTKRGSYIFFICSYDPLRDMYYYDAAQNSPERIISVLEKMISQIKQGQQSINLSDDQKANENQNQDKES